MGTRLRWSLPAVCALALALSASAVAVAQPVDPRQEARLLALAQEDRTSPRPLSGSRLLASAGVSRVVVGVRSPADRRRIAKRLRLAGGEVEPLRALSALSVRGLSSALVVGLTRGDAGVTYLEEDRTLETLADPYDAIDPATGINYNWAHDAVAADAGIAAVGGGSQFAVAVVDTGAEVGHPDLAGRIVGTYSAVDGGADVTDDLGHGTFVAGLISAIDGNGVGFRGAAGATNLLVVRASSPGGEFYESQLADAVVWATQAGARVINLSLGGPCPSGALIASALSHAFAQGGLVVAAAGNNAEQGNVPNCPAAELGGLQGGWGKGLSVGATRPDGQRAAFSTFNDNVSLAAPGASGSDCRFGVFSTLPSTVNLWDNSCSSIFAPAEAAPARWAYGEGTSFAAPLASAVAAITLQANPNLLPEQLAQVLKASAVQTVGTGWNAQTGTGIVNAAAAVDLARGFDTLEPQVSPVITPGPKNIAVWLDPTDAAREGEAVASGLTISVERSRDGVTFEPWAPEQAPPFARTLKASRNGPAHWFRATTCDANRNCSVLTSGPKRPVRIKPRVTLKSRKSVAGRGRAVISLKRVKGFKGRAKIVLERRVKRRFKPVASFRLAFGKSVTRKLKLKTGKPLKLRARVRSTPDWRGVKSRAISIAPKRARG